MLRFLPGILLLQAASVGLVFILGDQLDQQGWMQAGVILILLGVVTAFWFGSIARHIGKDRLHDAHQSFAQEREKLLVKSERDKRRVAERAHKRAHQEVVRARASASLKIGAAFAGVAGAGVLMLFTQFVTVGLLVLATTGGAAAGYLLRVRHESARVRGAREPSARITIGPAFARLPAMVRSPFRRLTRDKSPSPSDERPEG